MVTNVDQNKKFNYKKIKIFNDKPHISTLKDLTLNFFFFNDVERVNLCPRTYIEKSLMNDSLT